MPIEPLGDLHPDVDPTAFVHPSAVIIGDVVIGPESSVWPGAVLRGDFGPIRIGARTSIQDNAVMHGVGDGTYVGDECVVGHFAFAEEALIEDACLIGVGSRILNGAIMRTGSVAAAGAVVLGGTEVPRGHRAQGVPAQVVAIARPSYEEIVASAGRYAQSRLRYHASGA